MNPGAGQPPTVTAAGRAVSVLLAVLLIIVAALTGSTPAADQAVTMALTASSPPMLTQPAAAPHSHLVSAVTVHEVENIVGPSARKPILLVGSRPEVSADHVGSVEVRGPPLVVGAVVAAEDGPTLFANKAPGDALYPPQSVPLNRLSGINGTYNLVVDSGGTLVVGRGGHIDLARGAPVQAAGEVKVVNGQVRMFNNASGHYQPSGPSIEPIARTAFEQQAGLQVLPNAYQPVP